MIISHLTIYHVKKRKIFDLFAPFFVNEGFVHPFVHWQPEWPVLEPCIASAGWLHCKSPNILTEWRFKAYFLIPHHTEMHLLIALLFLAALQQSLEDKEDKKLSEGEEVRPSRHQTNLVPDLVLLVSEKHPSFFPIHFQGTPSICRRKGG